MVGDILYAGILNGLRLPFGLIFLVKIDNNLATGGIVYLPPSCSIGPLIIVRVLYTQKHVARQPPTVCY